jgi:hypothetical protein
LTPTQYLVHRVPEGSGRRRLSSGVRWPALEDSHSSYNPGIENTVDLGKGGQCLKIVIHPTLEELVELLTRFELSYQAEFC